MSADLRTVPDEPGLFLALARRTRLTAVPAESSFGRAEVARGDGRRRDGDGADGQTAANRSPGEDDGGAGGAGEAVAGVEGASRADDGERPARSAGDGVSREGRADASGGAGESRLSVTECRALLGGADDLTDQQVAAMRDGLYQIAEVVADAFESKGRRGRLRARF
jgi:hypothetical protein